MSRLILKAIGGNLGDTLALEQGPEGAAGVDEVVVEILAAPINGADFLFAAGWFGVQPQIPAAMGAEGVGRVVEVGPQADPALIGRRVLVLPTFHHGTWATRTVVPTRNVIPMPDDADPLQLAMLSVNPAAAYALLHDFVALEPGDWVGINLANSAVGHYVIALARRAGIKTLAVVRRNETADVVRKLGADAVLVDGDRLGERATEALQGARLRLLFDGTGEPVQVAQLVSALEDGGSVIVFASVTGQGPSLPLADVIYRDIALRGFFILNWLRDTPRERLHRLYDELSQLVGEGAIHAEIEATYPLERYSEALLHAAKNSRNGKILFIPNGGQALESGPALSGSNAGRERSR